MTLFEVTAILVSLIIVEFIFGAISLYQNRKLNRHYYSVLEYNQVIDKLALEIAHLKAELAAERNKSKIIDLNGVGIDR